MNSLNPVFRIGRQIADGILAHRPEVSQKEALERAGRAARARRHLPRPPAVVPAPALGRHAPARHDRHGARARPAGAHHGRADDGARRGRCSARSSSRSPTCANGSASRSSSSRTTCRCSSRSPTGSRSCTPARSSRTPPPLDVYQRPRHPYSSALLHSFPPLRGPRRELTRHPRIAARPVEAGRRMPVPGPLRVRLRRLLEGEPRARVPERAGRRPAPLGRVPPPRPGGRARRRRGAAARSCGAVGALTRVARVRGSAPARSRGRGLSRDPRPARTGSAAARTRRARRA